MDASRNASSVGFWVPEAERMSDQSSADSPLPRVDVLLEQYKLALEAAARMSARRQDANNFYIAVISAFGALYSLLEKAPGFTRSVGGRRPADPSGLLVRRLVVDDPTL
jgi:hypothetical protein